MEYVPFYAFAAATLFGGLAFITSVFTLFVPQFRRLAVSALSWGGVPALFLPILVIIYVKIHLTYFGPIRDDLGLLFYLVVTPFTGYGLGTAALAVRHIRKVNRSSNA
jgi:magnesium-transporting ATPase (P-type)